MLTSGTQRLLKRATSGVKVVSTLGPRWALTRAQLAIEDRLGVAARRTPLVRWADVVPTGNSMRVRDLINADSASEILSAQPDEIDRLRAIHIALRSREFDVFGTPVHLDSWHHDQISGANYPSQKHWSHVHELTDHDIKLVWEPSRFSWAFDLARLHAVDPDSGAADTFWELFESWCAENQPNAGVNWQCGQESSLRFMAIMFATQVFGNAGSTVDREQLLNSFADVTGRRVLAHWRYARSQKNNHIVSEAVGLIGVGTIFPELEIAAEVVKKGTELLVEACQELVFTDGGTSQYSLNYHRVFLHNFLWARLLVDSTGRRLPELDHAIDRASHFLASVVTADGSAAISGHNDGAHLLPLSSCAFGDMRPTLMACGFGAAEPLGDSPFAPQMELAAWLGITPSRPLPELSSAQFPQMGLSVIRAGAHRAVVRGGVIRNRPAHDDQLHVDLWIAGDHVVVDPGTWSYKPRGNEPDLAASHFHNAPIVDGKSDMTRVSRFLFVDWSKVEVEIFDRSAGIWQGRRTSPATGMHVVRRIEADPDGWVITDAIQLQEPGAVTTTWVVPSDVVELGQSDTSAVFGRFRLDVDSTEAAGPLALSIRPQLVCSSYRTVGKATAITAAIHLRGTSVTTMTRVTKLR